MSEEQPKSGEEQRSALAQLLEKSRSTDIPVLLQAKEKAKQLVRQNPSSANVAALDKATKMLDEFNRAQSADGSSADDDDTFATKLDAWQYLQDSGWQIGRSQFYEHCKQGRLPRKDGRYLRADVDRYAQHHCRAADTGEKVNEKLSRIAEEKIETELARDKTRLEKDLMELAIKRGEYVPRDEVEQMIVGRAVALLAHLRAMAAMKASDFIALVAGDQRRQRDLIDALNENIEDYVAIFAKDIEFEVIFEKNE